MTLSRKNLSYLATGVFIALSLAAIFFYFFNKKKLNILIISTCSLSANRMGLYNDNQTTPNVTNTARNSFLFSNAFTDMSWSNVFGFLSNLTASEVKKLGYHAIGHEWTPDMLQHLQVTADVASYYYGISEYKIADKRRAAVYFDDLAEIKNRILNKSSWPFLVEVHSKIMHLPYGRKFENSPPFEKLISKGAQSHIAQYKKNFEKFPERTPFGLLVGGQSEMYKHIIENFKIKHSLNGKSKIRHSKFPPMGILNNDLVLKDWKKSKYFTRDLEVVKEVYDKRLMLYDESIKDMLNLYEDSELAKNTVLIYTGDHGEAFFEHGHIAHGNTVFDEMIRFPLFIKFPGQKGAVKIDQQFYQKSIYDIVRNIMTGELTFETFETFTKKKLTSEFIHSRTCANDVVSLRYKNTWKLIEDFAADKKYLYNLKEDPKELFDVFEQFSDVAAFLTEKNVEITANQEKNRTNQFCTKSNE